MIIKLNNQNLAPILVGQPKITDQLNGVCRTLSFSVLKTENLDNYLGQSVELWYNNVRWFKGDLKKRGFKSDKSIEYLAYDPLFYLAKNPDDWYFKNSTATQDIRDVFQKVGVKIDCLEETGAVLAAAYYKNKEADKIIIDRLAKTYEVTGQRYWFRYQPETDGARLFKRLVPEKIWSFQSSINLTSAEMEESIEDTISVVKLINRNTGKTVTKVNAEMLNRYGHTVLYEEVEKDELNIMETMANRRLNENGKVAITMKAEGINPDGIIPQLFSGDPVYVEEKNSRILGGYYIRNITHTFVNDRLITVSFDMQAAPDIPTVQYEDAEIEATKKTGSGTGVQQEYSAEVKGVMDKYGL